MEDTGYTSYRMAQIVSRILPRRFAYWLGLRAADRFFSHDHFGRRAVMSNLAQVLAARNIQASEESLRQMARQNFQMFGKYLVDFFKFHDFSSRRVKRLVSLEGVSHLDQAESAGRGVIIITAHLGNWELGGAVLSSLGKRMNAVFQPLQSNKTNELFQRHREKRGMRLIERGNAARGVIRALRNREYVAMLADRDYSSHNEIVPFFGKPARLPSGPARICAITGAPIVPSFLLRQADDTFLMRMHPPILPAKTGGIEEIWRLIRDIMEEEIAENPLQWFMFEDLWARTKDDG